jgi:hypothetical protein
MLRIRIAGIAALLATGGLPLVANAYPGGTPTFQTDVAPFCAGCHSSIDEAALAGAGERAVKEIAANKHLAPISAGEGGYQELSEADRASLIEHIRALDAASSIEVQFPAQVTAGESFTVTVVVTGGSGPVVGVALVDRAHRWYARPAAAAGWRVVGAPTVIGQDGKPQSDWIDRRPETVGRGISFVNVSGIESDPTTASWASAKAIFTLKAPEKPGNYPLVGAFFYGTEKASPHGYKLNTLGWKMPRGTSSGGSGRVRFSREHTVLVNAPAAAE